jgi:hypothetical protein
MRLLQVHLLCVRSRPVLEVRSVQCLPALFMVCDMLPALVSDHYPLACRLSISNMRMRIPYDDLPNTSRLIALCQVMRFW